jgi:hypothetical protein
MDQPGGKAKREWNAAGCFGFAANHDRLGLDRIDMGSGRHDDRSDPSRADGRDHFGA